MATPHPRLQLAVAKSVVWSWLGVGTSIGIGFFVARFLIHRLGDTTYGLWIVLTALTEYLRFMDLGVRGSIGRFMAFHRARGDTLGINTTLSSGGVVLAVLALGCVLITAVMAGSITRLLDLQPAQSHEARTAFVIVGMSLAIGLLLNVFDATLWAYERFDVLNIIDIPVELIRAALVFTLVGHGFGLVALAWISLFTTVLAGLAKAVMALRVVPSLRPRARLLAWGQMRTLLDYGIWNFLRSLAQLARKALPPTLIAASVGLALVTPFSIAARLVAYAALIVAASAAVATPLATKLHATENWAQQQTLALRGSRFAASLALFLLGLFVLLGRPLITLWVGPRLADAYPLLVLLALGELIPMSQLAMESLLLAAARHKALALASIIETVMAAGLALLLLRPFGLAGACVAFAVSAACCRGLFTLVYGCRVARLPLRQYVRAVVLPALGTAAPSILLLGILVRFRAADGWPGITLYGAAAAATFAVATWPLLGLGKLLPELLRQPRRL